MKLTEISTFYRDVVATVRINCDEKRSYQILSLSRGDFLTGSAIAAVFLIQRVAVSFFSLLRLVFSGFQNERAKASLTKNLHQIPTYLGAIPIGLAGVLAPQTVQKALGIPVGKTNN